MEHTALKVENVVGIVRSIGKLEGDVAHLQKDVGEIKTDIGEFRERQDRDFRLLFGALIAAALGLGGLMAKGFGWF